MPRLFALPVLFTLGAVVPVIASEEGPLETIRAHYARYWTPGGDIDPTEPRQYSPRVRGLLSKLDRVCAKVVDVPCGIDFDIFAGEDNADLRAADVQLVKKDNYRAEVEARFTNRGKPRLMRYALVHENGRWLIDQLAAIMPDGRTAYTLDGLLNPKPR